MFIVLEGLDAAGKNTISKLVVEEMNKNRMDTIFYDKNIVPQIPNDVGNSFECLYKIIYIKDNQSDYNLYNKEYWATIQASWFNLQYNFGVKPLLKESNVVCSGWFYKFIAKYLYKGIDSDWIQSVFSHIRQPDLVILLDFESNITVKRREHFTDTEVGYLDGFTTDRTHSFIKYQSDVLHILKNNFKGTNHYHISNYLELNADIKDTVNACINIIKSKLTINEGDLI